MFCGRRWNGNSHALLRCGRQLLRPVYVTVSHVSGLRACSAVVAGTEICMACCEGRQDSSYIIGGFSWGDRGGVRRFGGGLLRCGRQLLCPVYATVSHVFGLRACSAVVAGTEICMACCEGRQDSSYIIGGFSWGDRGGVRRFGGGLLRCGRQLLCPVYAIASHVSGLRACSAVVGGTEIRMPCCEGAVGRYDM